MIAAIDKKQFRNVLSNLAPQAKDLLVEMIKYPSTSGNEADVQTFLAQKWQAAGFNAKRHPIPESIKAVSYTHLTLPTTPYV